MISKMSAEQQRKLLVWLGAVFSVVMLWRFGWPAVDGWLDRQGKRAAVKRPASLRAIENRQVVEIRLADLQPEAGSYNPERNIFRFGKKPAPPPPPPVEPVVVVPVVDREPPPPPPPQEPKPPPLDVELVGIWGTEARRIAVLLDGPEIYNALENDIIRERFIVDRIDYEQGFVDFRFVGFSDDETARLQLEDS